ncbi:MAG: CRISPR-associated endonuclease Cas2 [Chloroflexi bacterium]|nr:CRISPR-associated endonuclease Cas2 [Chloroflexota bacterium]
MRSTYLVAYDVRGDGRLRRTARLIEGYGERVQYSLFRCRLSARELERLRWELARLLEPEDSLLIIPLCASCATRVQNLDRRQGWNDEMPSFAVV